MSSAAAWSLAAASALAAVQLGTGLLPDRYGSGGAPMRALSVAGGFSVAFVFLHLLPALEGAGDAVADGFGRLEHFTGHEAYLLALTGLVALYGLERFARHEAARENAPDRVLRAEVGAFACYYLVVGLLTWDRAAGGAAALASFTAAVGLHLLVVDWGIARRHPVVYRRFARPLLSASVLAGWAVGGLVEVPDGAVAALLAFFAGGVVMVALKEELPGESRGRFGWFFLGTVLYAGMLAALG